MFTSRHGGVNIPMKMTIRTAANADYLIRKVAVELDLTPEMLAEVAVYNLLASYLVDKYGQDGAADFLEHLDPRIDVVSRRKSGHDVDAQNSR